MIARFFSDPCDEFWKITDRGPNGQMAVDGKNRRTFWVPEFNPTIIKVKVEGDSIRILQAVPLVGGSGKPVTGMPNLKDLDETPYDYTAKQTLAFNPNGLDTEGLVRTTGGDFWIADEYSPSLVHLTRSCNCLFDHRARLICSMHASFFPFSTETVARMG